MSLEWAGPVVSVLGGLVTVGGFLVGTARLRAERGKLAAETQKTEADTGKVYLDTGLEGARVIKDISEAAAILVVPYRAENAELRKRLDALENRVERLISEIREKDEALHRERQRAALAQEGFKERTKALTIEYESQIQTLKARVISLNGSVD